MRTSSNNTIPFIMKSKTLRRPHTLLAFLLFFTVSGFAQSSFTWKNVAMGGGGYVTGIVIHPSDPSVMYIRTDVGGAYKWNTANSQWIPLTDMFSQRPYYSIDGIALDPNNKNVVYICAGNSALSDIFKSTNGGASWTPIKKLTFLGNGQLRSFGEPIQVDPNNSNVIYCGSRNSGLVRSLDGGTTWTTITSVPKGTTDIGIRSVVVDKRTVANGRSKRIYAAVYNTGIYVSNDGGNTFSLMSGSPTRPSRMVVATNGVLYVTGSTGVRKFDGSWKNISPASYVFNAIDVPADNPNKILVAADVSTSGIGPHKLPIYFSTNGGSSWTSIIPKSVVNYMAPWYTRERFSSATASVKFDPFNSNRIYLTDWYQVFRTDNITLSTVTWNQLIKGHEEMVVYAMVAPPHKNDQALLASFVADNKGFRHTSLTSYPSTKITFGFGIGLDFCESNPDYMFGVSSVSGSAAYSRNNGRTWITVSCPFGQLGKVAYSARDTNLVLVVPKNSAPVRSTNKGKTWQSTSGAPSHTITDVFTWRIPIASDRVEGSTFYLLSPDGSFYRSTNGGANWGKTTSIAVTGNYIVRAVPAMAGAVWVAGTSGGLYRSSSYGNSFTKITNVSDARLIAFGKNIAGKAYPAVYLFGTVSGITGVFRSTDFGVSWTRINDNSVQMGAAPSLMEADREQYSRVYVGTRGRGIFYMEDLSSTTQGSTSSMQETTTTLPHHNNNDTKQTYSSIGQNFPNPYNYTTTIPYTLPSRYNKALLKIFNRSGVVIKTFTLSGTGNGFIDFNSSSFISGSYYYSLVIDDKIVGTKMMILMK